jgi:phosphoketolase
LLFTNVHMYLSNDPNSFLICKDTKFITRNISNHMVFSNWDYKFSNKTRSN